MIAKVLNYPFFSFLYIFKVFFIKLVTVRGQTQPGTGVIYVDDFDISSKSVASQYTFQSIIVNPTSIIIDHGFTIVLSSIHGFQVARITISETLV
jgi:hypothetical protein